jgi:hypothetical protein
MPDTTADGSSPSAVFNNVADGIWYFHVRAGGPSGWGPARTVRIQVDTSGPRTAALGPSSVRRPAVSALRFTVTDTISPTARVVIRIFSGATVAKSISAGPRIIGGVRTVKWRCLLPAGRYTLKVYATDLAGNPQVVLGHSSLTVR